MFLIKKYEYDPVNHRRRIYFWQVPWGISTATGWQETGGWVPGSRYATCYTDPSEAERVILIRPLPGAEVDEVRPTV